MRFKEPLGRIKVIPVEGKRTGINPNMLKDDLFPHQGISVDSFRGYRTGSKTNPNETVYINRFKK